MVTWSSGTLSIKNVWEYTLEIVCYNCDTRFEVNTDFEDYGECPTCGKEVDIGEYLSDME